MKLKIITIIGLILFLICPLLSCSSPQSSGLDSAVNTATKSYRFSIFRWEVTSIAGEIKGLFTRKSASVKDTQTVIDYFTGSQQQTLSPAETDKLRDNVQRIIGLQLKDILKQDGVTNPFHGIFGLTFPPVLFELTAPPHLLIISPRDRIFEIRSILLRQNLTTDQMDKIETQAEKSGYSALVVELGGLGATVPSFVNSQMSLHDVLNDAAEEWLHQYLAFKPLGFRYALDLLGVSRSQDIITMNESVAGTVSQEIGSQVYDKYYKSYFAAPGNQTSVAPAFDFNTAMRQIRQTVDADLASGQIDQAEQYMNEQRDYLQTQGYFIRKLNQAYFAFYGTYADLPAYTNPIGSAIQNVRDHSASLKDFLNRMASVTSVSELDKLKSKLSP
ncbi:MAG: hypothetical protein ABR886_06700 [Dehalococcoidales bacterium]|jgi:hypothetical protein